MNKTIRIVLYVLSLLTVAGVIAAAILTGGQAKPASAPGVTAEGGQAGTSDAETTPDGTDTADGSGISTDGAETTDGSGTTPDGALDEETASGDRNTADGNGTTADGADGQVQMETYQMMQPQQVKTGINQTMQLQQMEQPSS